MKKILNFIEENSAEFLIMEGKIPTLTLGLIKEEFILYNLREGQYAEVLNEFNIVSEKKINEYGVIANLSHGQKLILSAIIVLFSTAKKIKFHGFFISLSDGKKALLMSLILKKRAEGKIIELVD